jgi:hypothetical protein
VGTVIAGRGTGVTTTPGLVPVVDGAVPVVDGAVPVVDGAVPVVDGAVPVVDGAVPVVDGAVPVLDGAVPVVDVVVPGEGAGEGKVPIISEILPFSSRKTNGACPSRKPGGTALGIVPPPCDATKKN